MGGAGPYFDFDTTEYAARCQHTKLSQLGDDVLHDTWARAHAWLLTSVRDVLRSDGWMLEEADICGKAAIILKKSFDTKDIGQYYHSKIVEARVAIPGDISVLFHPDFKWHQLFGWSLDARRQNRNSSTMYADAVHSCIADYFYLIQVILPGLVGLVREEEYDDGGKELPLGFSLLQPGSKTIGMSWSLYSQRRPASMISLLQLPILPAPSARNFGLTHIPMKESRWTTLLAIRNAGIAGDATISLVCSIISLMDKASLLLV
ncbi:hypothetical protein DFH06DRAFT_1194399, partial [Mycena polygramma]